MDEPPKPQDSPYDIIGVDLGISSGEGDSIAKREVDEFGSGEIEQDTKDALQEANERREELTRENFHRLFLIGLRVVGISLIGVFFIRILHIGFPESWHWLSDKGVQDIDRMLFSGAAGGLLIKYLEPIINGRSKN